MSLSSWRPCAPWAAMFFVRSAVASFTTFALGL
jgi:hypothetical protein